MRTLLLTLAATILLAGPAAAQTSVELLEKAIYLQDVAGDDEGATALYRQILKTPSAQTRPAEIASQRLSRATRPIAAAAADSTHVAEGGPDNPPAIPQRGAPKSPGVSEDAQSAARGDAPLRATSPPTGRTGPGKRRKFIASR